MSVCGEVKFGSIPHPLLHACPTDRWLAGCLAADPPDTIKARLQVQGADGAAVMYRGTLHAFRRIAASEGLPGFYRGFGGILLTGSCLSLRGRSTSLGGRCSKACHLHLPRPLRLTLTRPTPHARMQSSPPTASTSRAMSWASA